MHNIFDSHAHYDDESFDGDRNEVLAALPEEGICGVVNCGVDIATSKRSLQFAEQYDYIYAACGFHPHESAQITDSDCADLYELLWHKRCVAVGEIGLDYHYDFSPREVQLRLFETQLKIAKELDKCVIVHDREAHEDTLRLLKQYRPKGVLHCYSGSVEMAREILKLDMYIGLGGAVTFKNAKKPLAVAAFVPEDRLLVETDAPYMTPVPFRGQRCDSRHIRYTAQKLAEVRGVETQALLDITHSNARRLFFGQEL
ncbi:MAG: TatD family hydrolase [Oscillospiraceae bacterium]|jgi:TatD DNase family protein|nr:TatD family hydrolase [Oscillospiraceae bacterium]